MGRVSQGIQALKVGTRERIVGCIPANSEDELILITRQGYAKRIPISAIRIVQTGNMGTHAMQFAIKTDNLIHINLPPNQPEIEVVTTTNRRESIPLTEIKIHGKDGIGDQIINLGGDEEVMVVN
jgi:DNA gyrase subunit A